MSKTILSRRDALKLFGAGAAGALLASCKGTPATPTITPAPTHTAEVQLPTAQTLEGFKPMMSNPPEKVKLLYWWGNNYEPAMNFTHEIIKRFSLAYSNVEVEAVGGQNCDAFVTAAAAGTPPDLFHTWDCVERMGNWAMRDMIIPLDNYITASNFDLNDFVPGIMDTCKMDGKIWGMVDTAGVFLLWGRPQQFTEIGKTTSDVPKDTDELWDWSNKLTTKDAEGNINRMGMVLPTWTWPRLTWLVNFGAEMWDMAKNEPSPDHPGAIEALNDLVAQVNLHGSEALDKWSTSIGSQGGEQNPWLAGNLTFQVEGDWNGQQIFDFFPNWEFGKDYTAIAPPPPPANKQRGQSAVAFWSWPWVIPSKLKTPDWSWELLRFFKAPEYVLNVHSKFKEIAVQKSMMGDKRLWWPAAKVALDIVNGGRKLTTIIPMVSVAGEYINLLGEAFDKVLHLTETPEEAMKRVKAETIKAMQEAQG